MGVRRFPAPGVRRCGETLTRDHSIATAKGNLFARVWVPADSHSHAAATILLFHDSLGCVDLWRDFPRRLAIATGRSVVAYDRLGFGRSDHYPGQLPPSFISGEAELFVPVLCDALGLDAIVPFGHSIGGSMAMATAARMPERCGGVITESSHSFVEDRTRSSLLAARADFARPAQFRRLERYHGDKSGWILDAWIETWLTPEFAHWRLEDEVGGVHCPVLALHGDRDEYGSRQHPERIASLTQREARVVILEDCGHFPHREQPERVLSEVSRFLASLGEPRDK